VTVLEADAAPVVRGVGPVVGRALARLHHDADVDLRVATAVDGVEGRDGRVAGVRLGDGTQVPADVVVVGVGVRPATAWLEGAGLRVEDGVVVDDRCRAVGGGGHVWAVGDVARWPSGRFGHHLRTEHWTGAVEHASTLAANLLDEDVPHDPVPYVWSDQFGHRVQVLGHVRGDDEVVTLSGALDADQWVVGFVRDGRVVGVVGLDDPGGVMGRRALVERTAPRDDLSPAG
jgi:NADPH-dependent 2,4-dienoyl-CoA reductase/sulfur reductase-like enzyme